MPPAHRVDEEERRPHRPVRCAVATHGAHRLAVRVTDPGGCVEGFYFVDPEGTAWATDREERGGLVVVSARAETPGPEWGLRVRLKTPSTLRRYRFALKDVPLP